MKAILLLIKGFIMGIANVIPGVSGGTLAIIVGIYERLINVLSCFWKNFKENLKFIIPVFLGMGLAILGGSFIIDWGLDKYPIATMMFFIGLIIGGVPFIYIKVHKKYSFINVSIFIIIAVIVIFINLLNIDRTVSLESIDFLLIIRLLFAGMITAGTMIIPGISGSLVLMNLGYYEGIIGAIKNLTDIHQMGHSICLLLPFGIGVIIGLVLIARLIKWLLAKFPVQSYFGILAFILSSIVCIILKMDISDVHVGEVIIGILLLIIGAFITFILGRYDYKKNKEENIESSSEENNIETNNLSEEKKDE